MGRNPWRACAPGAHADVYRATAREASNTQGKGRCFDAVRHQPPARAQPCSRGGTAVYNESMKRPTPPETTAPPPVDVERVAADWAARGFSCAVWVDAPGQRWEGFVHRVDELAMVIEGDVEFEVAGRRLRPAPGQEVFIPAGAVHSVRNVGETTARWLYGYRR